MAQPTGRQGKTKNLIETCAATLILASIRDFVTTLLANPICCLLRLIAYAGWWSTQAVYTPNDSKDQISKRHEFALLVECSPAAATHVMTAMMTVGGQLHETTNKRDL